MLIELYGLSGSGKSTLAKNLVSSDSTKFVLVDFKSKVERYFYLLLYIVSHPVNFYQWLIFLLQNKKLFVYKLHLLSLSLAKMQKAKTIKNTNLLIDEGFLQRILTIADRPVDNKLLSKLLKYLDIVDQLIIMEGGDFYRFTEDKQKDNSPRVKLGKEYFESWKKLQHTNHTIIKKYLAVKTTPQKHIYSIREKDIKGIVLELRY